MIDQEPHRAPLTEKSSSRSSAACRPTRPRRARPGLYVVKTTSKATVAIGSSRVTGITLHRRSRATTSPTRRLRKM
jgi:hypothetical protein